MSTNPTPFEQKQKERAEIINQIKTTLTKLKRPDQVFEIRLFLKDGKTTIAGMFDHSHIDDCIAGIWQYYQAAKAIYFVLNDFPLDLLSWSANKFRVVKSGDHTVADKHISHRTHILIDIDPKRLSKEGIELADVSSTDEEKEKAKHKLNEVLEYLRSLGWPEPLIGSSGNGYHLIYAIDLPNTEQSTQLVKNFLKVLAQKFDDPYVQIDTKVFNAARITKLFGTVARKGDSIEGRPHRTAKILELPEEMLVVTEEQLAEVASLFKEETKTTPPKTENTYSESKREPSNKGFTDLSTRIRNYMDKLPMAVSGSDGSGATFRASCILLKGFGLSVSEALPYLESWNQTHCSPTWSPKDLLHKLNDADKAPSDKPIGYLLNDTSPKQSHQTNQTPPKQETEQPKTVNNPKTKLGKSGQVLMQKDFEPLRYCVDGIIPEGVTLLVGKSKIGKSAFALGVGASVATGGKALGSISVQSRPVLYCALEDGERRLQDRLNKLLMGEQLGENFFYETQIPPLFNGGLELLEEWLQENNNALVVIDVLQKVRGSSLPGESVYDRDYRSIVGLKDLAEKYRASILVLHHTRKADAVDFVDSINGSMGLSGAVDTILLLSRDRCKGDAKLSISGREVEERELALEFNFPSWKLLGDADEVSQSQIRRAIINILQKAGRPLSPKDVFEQYQLQDENIKYNTIKQRLYQMSKDGHLKAVDGGKYTPPISTHTHTNNHSNYDNYHNLHNRHNREGNSNIYTGQNSNNQANKPNDIDNNTNNKQGYDGYGSSESSNLSDSQGSSTVKQEGYEGYEGYEGSKSFSDSKSIIEVTPEVKLARRALACGEWLGLNSKLVSRVLLNNGEMLTEPEQYCRFLHRQFKQGVQQPNFVKELEIIETTISTAIKSLSVSGH